jgi:type II secretory pathway pseudopilin PulG
MSTDLERRIEAERVRILALDSRLDDQRTPYAKGQLRLALHFLDDTKSALRNFNCDPSNRDWVAFATDCLRRASQKRLELESVTRNGDPSIIEIGR